MKAAPRLPSRRFSDKVSAGVLGPAGAGVATTAGAGAGAATVVVLLTGAVEQHPASTVAATNKIGMMLRIVERFNIKYCFYNPPCSRAYGIRLANFNQVISSQKAESGI
ncbi:MAG: hypothetical protein ABSG87_08855 [Verrucomicrobiota bacterium]